MGYSKKGRLLAQPAPKLYREGVAMEKNKQKIQLLQQINEVVTVLEQFLGISISLANLEGFIDRLLKKTPGELIPLMEDLNRFFDRLEAQVVPHHPGGPITIHPSLLEGILSAKRFFGTRNHFPDSLILASLLVWISVGARISHDIRTQPNSEEALIVKWKQLLEEHSVTRLHIEEALDRLSRRALQELEKKNPRFGSYFQLREPWPLVDKASKEALPGTLREDFLKATRGDVSIAFIPHAVAMDLYDENRKLIQAKRFEESLDEPIATEDFEITLCDILFESLNWEEILESRELISKCLEIVNDPKKTSPLEKRVFLHRCIEGLTQRETAKELKITRQTVSETEIRLRKKLKSLKFL